jgi:hypothetical protein
MFLVPCSSASAYTDFVNVSRTDFEEFLRYSVKYTEPNPQQVVTGRYSDETEDTFVR